MPVSIKSYKTGNAKWNKLRTNSQYTKEELKLSENEMLKRDRTATHVAVIQRHKHRNEIILGEVLKNEPALIFKPVCFETKSTTKSGKFINSIHFPWNEG